MSPLSSTPPRPQGFRRKRIFGFTIVELLGVVVVIGILAAISLVKYNSQKEKAYRAEMLNDVRNFATIEETNASLANGYVAPSALPGFKYSANVGTLGFASSGNAWALLVTHSKSNTVCGAQSSVGSSIRPSCGTPSSTGIQASTTTPTAGQAVVYDVSGYLSQVAIASPALPSNFFAPALLASSNYSNATLIAWDYGDGVTFSGPPATAAVVTHTYTNAGKYVVKVGIVGASGAIYSAMLSGQASGSGGGGSGNQMPTAAFTVSANPVDAGTSTSFDASTSSDADGSIASYQWSFGDGGTATGVSASHAYTAAGAYTVTLTVTDNQGGTGVVQQSVTVSGGGSGGGTTPNIAPVAAFTAPSNALSSATVSFDASGSTDSDGSIASYAWDFGDGQTSTGATTTHAYSTAGNFTATLTVTDNLGATGQQAHAISITAASPPTASASASPSTSVEPNETVTFAATGTAHTSGATIASYSWDFGDFSTGTGASATHGYSAAGTWAVVLTVTDSYGQTGTANVSMTVAAPIATQFTAPATSLVNHSSSFASATQDNAGHSFSSVDWNFGDGTAHGTTATVTHAYATTGTKTVTLTLTNSLGNTVVQTGTVSVTAGAAPTAAFSSTPAYPAPGASASFDASSSRSNNSGGSLTAYAWDFGDGTLATGATTTHAFTAASDYTVTLTVTDETGTTSSAGQTVTVDAPVANFTGATSLLTGQTVTYTSTSTDAHGTVSGYSWSITGGSPSVASGSAASITTAFGTAGTSTVSLTATNSAGASNTITKQVTVLAASPATVTLNVSPSPSETGRTVTFHASAYSNNGGGITNYHYDYGDGIVLDAPDSVATHVYSAGGNYGPSVTVRDGYNATGTDTKSLTIISPAVTIAMANGVTANTTVTGRSNTFSATNTLQGVVSSYTWAWGDGTPNTIANAAPSHIFTSAATRTITLTETDGLGASAVGTLTVTVAASQAPTAVITSTPASDTITTAQSLTVGGSSSVSNNGGGSITAYDWNWGDGTAHSTGVSPAAHAYGAVGAYTLTLTVTDEDGVTGQATVTVHVNAVDLSGSPPAGQDFRLRADQGVSGKNWTDISDNGAAENGGSPIVAVSSSTLSTSSPTLNGKTNMAVSATVLTFSAPSYLASTAATVVMVISPMSSATYSLDTRAGSRGFYLYTSPGAPEAGVSNNGGTSFLDASQTVSQSKAGVYILTVNGTTANFSMNGVSAPTKTATFGGPLPPAGTTWYIGKDASGSAPFSGRFYELIVYRRVLSGSDMTQLNSYLSNRYGN